MKTTARQYAQALHLAISETNPKDHDAVLDNFVQVLKESGHLGKLNEIEKEFLAYEKESRGVQTAEVASARKLSVAEEKKLIKDLNEHISGEVELKTRIDEGLVGGVMVKIGDEVIDGTVKKQLKNLKNKLTQNNEN